MKSILTKISVISIIMIAFAFTSYAQSKVKYYLRDSNPPGTYTAYINVWDNQTGQFLLSTPEGPFSQTADQYNIVPTSIGVPADCGPRWIIYIEVYKNGANPQIRQSALLTTAQYDAANFIPILLNSVTF
jgi:hypothetical protein